MPDESADRELDLSNLDSLLKDIEKDMEAAPPTPPAAGSEPGALPATVSEPPLEIPDLPPPVELDALKTVTVAAPQAMEGQVPNVPGTAHQDIRPQAMEGQVPTAEPPPQSPVMEQDATPPAPQAMDGQVPNVPGTAHQDIRPPAEQVDEEEEISTDELLSPPVRSHERDESDDMEDMFTDEEDERPKPVHAAATEEDEVVAEPAVEATVAKKEASVEVPAVNEEPVESAVLAPVVPAPAAPVPAPIAAIAEEDQSFLDALESDVEEKPMATEIPLVVGTPQMFADALRGKNYSDALQIGQSLRGAEQSVPFRINLAGAMYHAGMPKDAERELASILESNPYHVVARRNLEFVRAGH